MSSNLKKVIRKDSTIGKIAEKYDLPPLIVAYIRSALLRKDNKYDKQSLMYHIQEENIERSNKIQKLRMRIDETNIDSINVHILGMQKKMDFRQGVLAVLRTIDDDMLQKLLVPTI